MFPLRTMSFVRGFAEIARQFPATEESREFQLERGLLREIERAFDGLTEAHKSVASISAWRLDELEQPTASPADNRRRFRKPKLVLDSRITKNGNLTVSWRPAPGYERDTVHGYHYNARSAFQRPLNELLMIRNFATAADVVEGDDYYGAFDLHRLSRIVDLVRLLTVHTRELLSISCDVEVGATVTVRHPVEDQNTDLTNCEVQAVRPHSVVANAKNDDFIQKFQDRYSISAATFIGFVLATRRYRMPIGVMAQLLHDHHGMKAEAWHDGFQNLIEQYETKVRVALALRRDELPFKGTSLPDLKKMFTQSFPGRKSWHVGSFEPAFR